MQSVDRVGIFERLKHSIHLLACQYSPCAPQKPRPSGDTLFQLVFMLTAQDLLNCDPTIPRQSMSRMPLRKASRWRRLRGSCTQARMGASFVIVSHPEPQGFTDLSFVERDHEIQALSSYRSHQSFTIGIRLRCPDRRTQYSESKVLFTSASNSDEKMVSRSWLRN